MTALEAVTRIAQLLRGIAAEANRQDWPECGLSAQTALVAVDGLHNMLEASDIELMEVAPVKSAQDLEFEAVAVLADTVRQ